MINKDKLVFTCSKQMPGENGFVFNVHIEDYSNLEKYIHADILLPSYTVSEYEGFTPEDIEELNAYCNDHYEQLYALSVEEGSKILDS